jgi:hypothetical protein
VTRSTRQPVQTPARTRDASAPLDALVAAAAPVAAAPVVAPAARALVVQAKLVVGSAHDACEDAADRTAAEFIAWQRSRAADGAAPAEGRTGPSAGVGRSALARSAVVRSALAPAPVADPQGSFEAPGAVEARIEAARGKGAPLPERLQRDFGSFAGVDLSGVRVHAGGEASELSAAIHAKAFATGSDIFLGKGASVSDTGLIAHELAHVVQQGGVQRLARADIARVGAGEVVDGATTVKDDATVTGTQLGLGIANDDLIDGATKGSKGTGGGFGLASGIIGLAAAIKTFFEMWDGGSTEDRMVAAYDGVTSAGDVVKGAIDIAEAAGSAVSTAVMPGLDLAFALLSAIKNASQMVYLIKAKGQQETLRTDARTKGDEKLAIALGTALARSNRKLGLTAVQFAGDLTMAVGAIAQLAAGPFGTAVKFAGGMLKVAGAVAGAMFEHYEAVATRDARAEHAAAVASGDAEWIKKAETKRLSKDAAFAVHEIVEKAVTPDPATNARNPVFEPLLATYGIGPKWLDRYEAATPAERATLAVQAEDIVLRFIGADRDPKTISEMILGGLAKVWNWVRSLFGGSATPATAVAATPVQIMKDSLDTMQPLIQAYVTKKGKQGTGGVKPDGVNEAIRSAYNKLAATYTKGVTDDNDRQTRLKSIDDGILNAMIRITMPAGFAKSSIKVSLGYVHFTYPYPAVPPPTPASAPATTAAAPATTP